jgi:hypothetical protein
MQDALPEAGQVLTINLLAGNINEAYAKARLDARRFFVDGEVSLHLVEAELVTAPTNARGEPISPAQFGCKFTAWQREEDGAAGINVVHLPDIATALIDARTTYQLADNFQPNQGQLQDAVLLIAALGERGYRLVRKDTDDA